MNSAAGKIIVSGWMGEKIKSTSISFDKGLCDPVSSGWVISVGKGTGVSLGKGSGVSVAEGTGVSEGVKLGVEVFVGT